MLSKQAVRSLLLGGAVGGCRERSCVMRDRSYCDCCCCCYFNLGKLCMWKGDGDVCVFVCVCLWRGGGLGGVGVILRYCLTSLQKSQPQTLSQEASSDPQRSSSSRIETKRSEKTELPLAVPPRLMT